MKLLIIGFGGFIGAITRYSLSGWIYRLLGSGFPYGTLFVNVLGSLVLGFLLFFSEGRQSFSPLWRSFIGVGMMGALTTFSTFSYETFVLIQENLYGQVLLNIFLNILLTIIAVWIGMVIARLI